MRVVLATTNRHKVKEIKDFLKGVPVALLSLEDFPAVTLEETGESLRDNALQKAHAVAVAIGEWALSDDTGLFVAALEGEPGIFSARYAGLNATFEEHVGKLLGALRNVPSSKRQARFECVMALVHPDGREVTARGTIAGVIAEEIRGREGFGYDPVFFLPERGRTFAEMPLAEKNRISHRALALEKMRRVLEEIMKMGNRK